MFRKIVSSLSFSPALVSQIGFYAKRLKKEEAVRRMGLVFTCLALVVQSFAVFAPPEAANAASSQDLLRGGVKTLSEFLTRYDKNESNIKDLFNSLGITRAEIKSMKKSKDYGVNSKDIPYSFGMGAPRSSVSYGDVIYKFPLNKGGTGTVHYHPLSSWDTGNNKKTGSWYTMLIGNSKEAGKFYIMLNCANLGLVKKPVKKVCKKGDKGIYPDCWKPCAISGKENLKATSASCKKDTPNCTIAGKTNLKANDPSCKKDTPQPTPQPTPRPAASCSYLNVTSLADSHIVEAAASVSGGARISEYIYTLKRDGNIVKTTTRDVTTTTDGFVLHESTPGTYTIDLAVKTSAGSKTSSSCSDTFIVSPPASCYLNHNILASDPDCQPCPGDNKLWIKDPNCASNIVFSKTAINNSRNDQDATKTVAGANDRITYKLTVENRGLAPEVVTPVEHLADVLDYADVVDNGGASFDSQNKQLHWSSFEVAPNSTQTRLFSVQILKDIPAVGTGQSDKSSYDCRIDNTFGNTVSVDIDCPVQKQAIEQVVSELPHTGPRENMLFAGIILALVTFFYLRALQTKKELRLIRRDMNAGVI